MRADFVPFDLFFANKPADIPMRDWLTHPGNKYQRPLWYDRLINQVEFWSKRYGETICHQPTLAAAIGVGVRSLRTALRFLERFDVIVTECDGQNYHHLNPAFFKKDLPKPKLTQPAKEEHKTEPVTPISNVADQVADQVAEHEKNKDLNPFKKELIMPSAPTQDRKDDKKRSDPIVQTFEQTTGKQYRHDRDSRALVHLHQCHFIAVIVGIIATSLNAKDQIHSLAYCLPAIAQMQNNKAHEQAGFVGYALSKLAPTIRDNLLPVLAGLPWPRGWDKELLALQAAIETKARKQSAINAEAGPPG